MKKSLIPLTVRVILLSWVMSLWMLGHEAASHVETSSPPSQPAEDKEKIEAVVKAYIKAIYTRNYSKAYELTSTSDRQFKTLEDYLRENGSFTGLTLELAEKLASFITYKDIKTEIQGDRAKVTVNISLPDGNAPEVESILLEEERPKGASREELLEKLETLQRAGKIPLVEGEQPLELIRENEVWRVFLNWGGGVRVNFKGVVKNNLPWSFEPVQKLVLIQPGETLRNAYRVKNLSDKPVTGKALHGIEPRSQESYLHIIQCFCFLQETLQPGEEKELPLTFQLSWDTPKEVKELEVTYEFYPLEFFEEKWGKTPELK
ncbi:MAG TPA: cytochrome c oxidase assembly protein [Candidatus Limnocylindrales bacterium]|nr:cytochrome c oxidase assembly protein [Candidatus Limnocylindrales bacterium]